jgi:hypothetical protein
MRTLVFLTVLVAVAGHGGAVQTTGQQETAAPALFAVMFRTGPKWDPAKPPGEQAFFKEHSANLARLRKSGRIALGARYADVGLIVVPAASEAEVRNEIARDPGVANGTFVYELHPFAVFYDGCLK